MQLSTVLRRHLGSMLLLAGPILVSQYAYLASGMADTVMSGMLGTVFQAGVAVGAAVPLRASQRAISSPATLPGSTMQRYCRNSVW